MRGAETGDVLSPGKKGTARDSQRKLAQACGAAAVKNLPLKADPSVPRGLS